MEEPCAGINRLGGGDGKALTEGVATPATPSHGKRRDNRHGDVVEEPYTEGVATHGGPGHALATREGAAKRWTGVRTGQLLSREMG